MGGNSAADMKPTSSFESLLKENGLQLQRDGLQTLQVNVGRKCNQACRHCHVDAAPWRTEMMGASVARRVGQWIEQHQPPIVDLTGGAPELSDHFCALVETARGVGSRVIDRSNLTIIEAPSFAWLPEYLAAHQIEVVASLPCYLEENVNAQRGDGVFQQSIAALKKLNAVGYGSKLTLNLVYNPLGPQLPSPQAELEADYREALARQYGVTFNNLFTITNQPIARFAQSLRETGRWEAYMQLLRAHFNPATIDGLMCRSTLSVGLAGEVYDCDFNQMLNLQLRNGRPLFLWDLRPEQLPGWKVRTDDHCLACTAGCGSSCAGALS
jgi:radical SAM/Cys-rich protein